MRILVTAVGGDIGYRIGKILRATGLAEFTIGCDIHEEHAGRLFFDRCEVVPRVNADGYVDALLRVARENRVDLIIPASEAEIRFFLERRVNECLEGIPLLQANRKSLVVGLDKLRTADFLRESNLPYPWTTLVSDGPPISVPCIVKDRYGAGGRSVAIVTEGLVPIYKITHPTGIWQELLLPGDEEYTCGLYQSNSQDVRHIVFRRKLVGGATQFGTVVDDNSSINDLLVRLAKCLELRGSINVQLRMTERGPVIFEINPRFSSTLVFRDLLGFRDVIWSIKERLGLPIQEYAPPPNGTSFFRGSDELIFPPKK